MHPNHLKQLLRSKILNAIKQADEKTPYTPKVVAVDDRSLKLLQSCLTNSEVCTGGVTGFVNVFEPTTPQPGTEVIYFVSPSPQVVSRICQDFGPAKSKRSPSQGSPAAASAGGSIYQACHLLFTYELDDALFKQLTSTITSNQYIKTLNELYVNFRVFEPLIFYTESSTQTFYNLFSPQASDRAVMEMEHIAHQLVSLCGAMQVSPLIRYHQPDYDYNTCTLSRQLAMLFQIEMDKFLNNHQDFEKNINGQTVFLILDRSMDLYAPFLHEFTYQAMANDLLPIESGKKYSYEAETGQGNVAKEAILDDKDTFWMDVRHKHIMDLKEIIETKQAELERQKISMTRKGENVSVGHLRSVVGSMHHFEKELEQFTAHHTMIHECFVKFGKGRLSDLANLEQILVTGKTAEGEVMKNLEMEMFPILDDPDISSMDKLRLLILYFTAKNGSIGEADRRKLLQIAHLGSKHHASVANLTALGFQFDKHPPAHHAAHQTNSAQPSEDNLFGRLAQSFRNRTATPKPDEDSYNLSRYTPSLKHILEDQLTGQLDPNQYPLVKPPRDDKALQSAVTRKSLRTVKATWAQPAAGSADMRRAPSQSVVSGGRLFVYVVGGVTYSEVRTTYELTQKYGWDIYLGGTHVFTPREFLHNLCGLHEPPQQVVHPNGQPILPGTNCTEPAKPAKRRFQLPKLGQNQSKSQDAAARPAAAKSGSLRQNQHYHQNSTASSPGQQAPAFNRYQSTPTVPSASMGRSVSHGRTSGTHHNYNSAAATGDRHNRTGSQGSTHYQSYSHRHHQHTSSASSGTPRSSRNGDTSYSSPGLSDHFQSLHVSGHGSAASPSSYGSSPYASQGSAGYSRPSPHKSPSASGETSASHSSTASSPVNAKKSHFLKRFI
ncbi:syntaxin binding protein 1 [Dimargaris verticillata]|uniref:Syntaxin binding protein 1 n=1 Tax=Dimargaris verticillata TaxID=2761393 RepID=A0A9W8B3Y0_9FUNG|nr:syntaxin binding protein 1 [Dimargaris verticillata]